VILCYVSTPDLNHKTHLESYVYLVDNRSLVIIQQMIFSIFDKILKLS